MLYADFVTIDELAAEVSVDLVEVHAVIAGEKGLHELEVCTDFVDVAGASGIITGGLDASGKTGFTFESHNIVGLPAM